MPEDWSKVMDCYVAGFLFSEDAGSVALIEKKKGPPAVVGKWNAIGGKIEDREESLAAMNREFIEEAGPLGAGLDWQMFLKLEGDGWSVDFYHAFKNIRVESMEQEKVSWFTLRELPKVVSNLNWIIPMALTHFEQHVEVYRVVEWLV
jgi:8-oxo-dGTP pyrophosphatase MutT (NUDIX family)